MGTDCWGEILEVRWQKTLRNENPRCCSVGGNPDDRNQSFGTFYQIAGILFFRSQGLLENLKTQEFLGFRRENIEPEESYRKILGEILLRRIRISRIRISISRIIAKGKTS